MTPTSFPCVREDGAYRIGPATKEDAIRWKRKFYQAEPCYTCEVNNGYKKVDCLLLVSSDACKSCGVKDAGDIFNVIHKTSIVPFRKTETVQPFMALPYEGVIKHGGDSSTHDWTRLSEWGLVQYNYIMEKFPNGLPSIISDCKESDTHYLTSESCDDCGGTGLKDSFMGECHWCRELKAKVLTPRQKAIEGGSQWYKAIKPCSKCGVVSEKHVANGRCKNCEDVIKQTREKIATPRMRAQANGDKWYSPGEACNKCGNKAERLVHTSECFACKYPGRYMAISYPEMVMPKDQAIALGFDVYREDGGEWKYTLSNRKVV